MISRIAKKLAPALEEVDGNSNSSQLSNVPDVVWVAGFAFHRVVAPKDAVATQKTAQSETPQSLGELLNQSAVTWEQIRTFLHDHLSVNTGEPLTEMALKLAQGTEESMREALLLAIDCGDQALSLELVGLMRSRCWSLEVGCASSVSFEPHLSPLMLACLRNDFGLVGAFLGLGLRLTAPHLAVCRCPPCLLRRADGESGAVGRLETLRAFASAAYLLLSSHDPLLLAADLANDLNKAIQHESAHKERYSLILEQVETFAAELGRELRTREEALLLLRKSEGLQLPCSGFPLPRLRILLDSRMKDFLAELPIQCELESFWRGGWNDESRPWQKRLSVLGHTLLYPLAALLFLVTGARHPASFRYPKARFVSLVSSYFVFITVLIAFMVARPNIDYRGWPEEGWQIVCLVYIWLYVFGLMWWGFMRLFKYGPRRFFSVWYHCLDLVTWLMYVLAWLNWLKCVLTAEMEGVKKLKRSHWRSLGSLLFATLSEVPMLRPNDTQLNFECCLSIAAMLSLWRAFAFVQLSRTFGPTIISVGRCLRDISMYVVIIFGILFSFALGLCFLYAPYQESAGEEGAFYTLPSALANLYWSFFGYLPPEDLKLRYKDKEHFGAYVAHIGVANTSASHGTIYMTGRLIVIVYHIFLVILMVNLMVALLVNSAGAVMVREEVEWAWMRAQLWAEMMEEDASLPPPFNFLHWLSRWIPQGPKQRRRFQLWPPNLWYTKPRKERKRLRAYQSLMVSLFYRYLSRRKIHFVPVSQLGKDKSAEPPSIIHESTERIQEKLRHISDFK